MNVRPKTVKLIEENIGGKLLDIGLDNGFVGSDSKSKGNISEYFKIALHQTRKLLHRKGINKMKSQPTERDKMFANHV